MADGSSLMALLSASEEPKEGLYRRVSSQVIGNPEQLLDVINSVHKSTLLQDLFGKQQAPADISPTSARFCDSNAHNTTRSYPARKR
ncbi:MAG: hypothetical protein Q9224_006243 [Gallowayella concinna]